MNYFEKLSAVDCSDHIEKKGKFSYLSWPFAVAELKKKHPDATWHVKKFNDSPYMKTEAGYFVEVEVKVDGIALSQIHPVLDNRNKPISDPNAFQINTSIQRCLVKAIALHGLGLYIYAGEDLPIDEDEELITAINNCASSDALSALWRTLTDAQRTRYLTHFSDRKEKLEQ